MDQVELNDFQRRLLELPEEADVFIGGGRGGGKSYGLGLLALKHIAKYEGNARVLYLRRTYGGLSDFELVMRNLFGLACGSTARYNAQEGIWRLPNGAQMELSQLDDMASYQRFQGRSFSNILFDEAGQYPMPDLIDMMRSNLRGPAGMPLRMVIAANPGGPGHAWLAKRYVFKAAPWKPFLEPKSNRYWFYAPSTAHANRFIDVEQYLEQLRSSCPDDPELLRAWVDGDWAVNRGAYFAAVLDENRNAVDRWKALPPKERGWGHWLALDFGSAAPSVAYLAVESPGAEWEGKFYPRGSVILVDELAAHRRDNLTLGLGWTAATTAEAIIEWCEPWGMKHPRGVADDACFGKTGHGATIAEEFSRKGVYFVPAGKGDRISGWHLMRRMLADAGAPDKPGLYVSRSCEYWWATVPYLARDTKRIEDVDSSGPDHGADACRYGIVGRHAHRITSASTTGW
jgi:hypothetical protein